MNNCTVPGCTALVKAKGLCVRHYERMRVHGDVTVDKRATGLKKCKVHGCPGFTIAQGLCAVHYARQFRHGSTDSKLPNYGQGFHIRQDGYKRINLPNNKTKLEHVAVAEKALGKPLPKGAVVHHINGDRLDNRPSNLVICPNQSYHMLLHTRQKQLEKQDWIRKVSITILGRP